MPLARTILFLLFATLAYPQVAGEPILSNQVDTLFNAANEVSAPRDMRKLSGGNSVIRTFSVQAIASGTPTTCTWNVWCTNKVFNNSTLAAGDYNSLGEDSAGDPADLSCLPSNAQRFTRFVDVIASTCYVELQSIGGGTSPAVTFWLTGGRE